VPHGLLVDRSAPAERRGRVARAFRRYISPVQRPASTPRREIPVDERARESAFLSALTTEHFVLQSSRGALISEMVGRGNVYLSAVSSALIAFGFWAQLGTRIDLFVAAVLPALFVFGELTFVALVRSSLKNLEFMRRMQKIRSYYRTLHPDAEQFFDPSDADKEHAAELATVGMRPGLGSMLLTGATSIAAIHSLLGAVGLALLAGRADGIRDGVVVTIGILVALLLFGLHLLYERRRGAPPTQLTPGAHAR
jgi:hypothetical protein